MKLLIAFNVYPRKSNLCAKHAYLRDASTEASKDKSTTYLLLERTFKTLFENQDFFDLDLKIRIIVVGDDYPNIEELRPIFEGYSVEFYNINQGDALRNMNTTNSIKWMQAVQRSKIFALEKSLEEYNDYDYLMTSADDDLYLGNKIRTTIEYIKKYNEPDFVYCLGKHVNGRILPKCYDANNLMLNFPEPSNCICSGTFYKISNKNFILFLINQRKMKWSNVLAFLRGEKAETIKPEDQEMWEILKGPFEQGVFISLLIPQVLTNHETENTLPHYT